MSDSEFEQHSATVKNTIQNLRIRAHLLVEEADVLEKNLDLETSARNTVAVAKADDIDLTPVSK